MQNSPKNKWLKTSRICENIGVHRLPWINAHCKEWLSDLSSAISKCLWERIVNKPNSHTKHFCYHVQDACCVPK